MTILYRPPPSPGHRAAFGLLAVSLLIALGAGVRAWRLSPLPGPETTRAPSALEPPSVLDPAPGMEREPLWSAVRAVERDPFHPERRAPEMRYLLPEGDGGGAVAFGGGAVQGALRLVGTAVSDEGGGFAMCQLGSDPPRILRVGETMGGLTLRSVLRGKAEFTREDGSALTLAVPGVPEASTEPRKSTREEYP